MALEGSLAYHSHGSFHCVFDGGKHILFLGFNSNGAGPAVRKIQGLAMGMDMQNVEDHA